MIVDRYDSDPSFEEICSVLHIEVSAEFSELDKLLDDPELFGVFKGDFQQRYPHSGETGRRSTPVEVLIRALTLKHALGWTYEETEEALRNNLMVRKFCRLYGHSAPDDTVLIRWDNVLTPSTLEALNARVVEAARRVKVTRGRKLRVDTTVVETNIHYPRDSMLLGDGIRVISRVAKKAKELVAQLGDQVHLPKRLFRDRTRSVKSRIRRLFTLSKAKTEAGKAQFIETYHEVIDLTKAGVRQGTALVAALKEIPPSAYERVSDAVERLVHTLEEILPRIDQVIHQATQRIFDGKKVPSAQKIVSLFEPHTAIIPKDKPNKPIQFGRKVKLDEVDGGIISHYTIEVGNPHDSQLFCDSIDQHKACFGKPPDLAAADRGFWSQHNEDYAQKEGVKKVVLPQSGKRSDQRREHEQQPWFRKGIRFRAGIEGRISTVKHNQLLDRCLNHGEDGFYRWVAWAVMGANLTKIAHTLATR